MAITRIVDTDDSGTGTNGTIHNNAWLQSIYQSIEDAFTWTNVAFNAANFTASGSMTWTVGAGDQSTFAYRKIGRTMVVRFFLVTTTVGGTPSTNLNIAIPGGFVPSNSTINPIVIGDNGTNRSGFAQIVTSGTSITCFQTSAAVLAASTNNTSVLGEIEFETTT